MRLALALACVALVASCAPPKRALVVPPVTVARPPAAPAAPPAKESTIYAGHGADSVPPEVLARFAPAKLPPEVSRRIQAMLDVRSASGVRTSPDGRTLYVTWNVSGTPQVWKVDGPEAFPVQLTGGEDPTRLVGMTPDGKTLVVSRDRKGEENPGLYLLPASGGPLRLVQHLPKVQTELQLVEDDGRSLLFRSNDVTPASYAIYRYDLASGTRTRVFGEEGLWRLGDARGKRLLLQRETGALTSEWSEYDEDKKALVPVVGQAEKEEYDLAYGPAEGEVLVRTPKLGEFRRVYRARIGTAPLVRSALVPVSPEGNFDVEGFLVDRARKNILVHATEGGVSRLLAFDARTSAPRKLPAVKGTVLDFAGPSPSGRFVVVLASSPTTPSTSLVLDWQTGKLTRFTTPSTPEVDLSAFADAVLETYPARDGTKIPAWVRTPAKCAKPAPGAVPCPVIVNFHGGPEGQALPTFSPAVQAFVDAGFVWVAPNVRGSDGYGKTWLHADDGPKRLAVVTDIEDAATWARRRFAHEGKAPKVGVSGGSYGGYSTLVAMTRFAGAYDAGVANVGMSNLLTFLLNTAPYRRALRASEYGDPEKDRDALLELSPITHIAKLKAPLMLIQGASDPRVPIGEAIQMHAALEKRGVQTKMVVFPDEGHGAQKRENKVLELGHTLDFFERHLRP